MKTPLASPASQKIRLRMRTLPPRASEPLGPFWRKVAWGVGLLLALSATIWVLRPVFAMLAASAGVAYLLDPIANWLERRGFSREGAIGIIFTSLIAGVSLVVLIFLPGFVREFDELRDRLIPFILNLDETIAPAVDWVNARSGRQFSVNLQDLQTQAPRWIAEQAPKLQEKAGTLVSGLFTQGLGLLNAILNIALLPIFVFYLLRDWDRLLSAIHQLIPPRFRPRVEKVAAEVDQRLGAFVRGQITVCGALAGLYSVGLLLVGIDLAVPIGLLSGFLFIVPYLGPAVGVVLSAILAAMKFGFGWELVGVFVVYGVVQGIEGYLLTPRIVGDKVGLHPLVVMIALLVGGSLLGIWGMFLAIPITAVLSVFASEWLQAYRQSALFEARKNA
jgi:predicted PurR-regulated permease PerM